MMLFSSAPPTHANPAPPDELMEMIKDGQAHRLALEQNHHEYEAGGVITEWLKAIYDIKPKFIAKTTARRYGLAVKKFREYAASIEMSSLPALPVTVAAFIHDEIAAKGGGYSEAKTASAAIAYNHTRIGCASPSDSDLVRAVVSGLKKQPTKQEIQ